MIRNKEGDNAVENVIVPKSKPIVHHLWNIACKRYIITGFREEWRGGSWIAEQLSCGERQNCVGLFKAGKQMAEGDTVDVY